MIISDRNSYLIKQSDGTIWDFSFKNNDSIIYKYLKNDTWSDTYILVNEASKNFSVILLPDDSISVLYQDLEGTVILSKYNGEQWDKQGILTNKQSQIIDVYFKTAVIGNKINIIFRIYDKEKSTSTLFHQVLGEKNDLSTPKVIEISKHDYKIPFILYSTDNKNLIIMYQRLVDNHEIGYRILNDGNGKWSDFKLIDISPYPFNDYSAVMSSNILHALYIKKDTDIDSLNYANYNGLNLKKNKLFKDTNIESCSLSILYDRIFALWIDNNKIYSSVSLDKGISFSNPPYEQIVNSSIFSKAMYISNGIKERKDILFNEIYFTEDVFQDFIFLNIHSFIKNSDIFSYIKYYITNIYSKVLLYEKNINDDKQLITQLNASLDEQKRSNLLFKKEFEEMNKTNSNIEELKNQLKQNITSLEDKLNEKEIKMKSLEDIIIKREEEKNFLKDRLTQNISLFQQTLYDRDNKINSLEKINKEKDEEILQLKDKFSRNTNLYQSSLYNKDNRINSLEKIINEKEKEILLLKEKYSQNINSFQNNSHDKDNKIKSLENINKEMKDEIALLKEKLSQITSIQENLNDKEKEIKSLLNTNKEKEDEIDILNEKLSENEIIILNLTRKIKELNKNIKIMYNKINQMNNKNY